jgi:signal transduction histidine kinase/CheY-like chemotaxis protein
MPSVAGIRLSAVLAPSYLLPLVLLCASYYATARIGLAVHAVGGVAALVWAPSGLALAALLLAGESLWPAVAAGSMATSYFTGRPLGPLLLIAVGTSLEAVIAARWVRRLAGPGAAALHTVRGALALVGVGAVVTPLLSAAIGTLGVHLEVDAHDASPVAIFSSWWIGDMLGVLIVTPFVLALSLWRHQPWRPLLWIEAVVAVAAVCAVCALIFGSDRDSPVVVHTYFIFPPLLWCALRLRQPGATLATLLIAVFATVGTARGLGPFADPRLPRGLLSMQAFLAIAALTVLILAAVSSERRRAAEQLVLADRLAAMGTLAAGIGHEINNPLAYLIMCLEMISKIVHRSRDQLGNSAQLEELLRVAREGADKMRRIVNDMRSLGRSHDDVRGPVDVHRVLESSLELAGGEIQARARVVKEFGKVPWVEANQGRLGQVFVNLLINAAQAIGSAPPEAHTIRIATRLDPRGKVEVSIRDTGRGIETQHRARLFEPFFTTKPVGEGVGLGLSVCHALVESLGGSIVVESESGQGTTFRVLLPVSPEQPPEVLPASRRRAPSSASLAVLIVEDEAHLAESLALLLNEHQVTLASNGRQALQRCAEQEFDIILCDLVMPRVSGIDLFEELRRTQPGEEQRIVFMTGGAFTPAAQAFLSTVPNRTLEKPFTTETLLQIVATVASSKRSAKSVG